MSQEIERKFLVTGDFRCDEISASRICQGYICPSTGKTVRVRVRDDKGYLTIKGPSTDGGVSRYEWEKEIPVKEALELLNLCDVCIDKIRHLVPCGNHIFEVDEFLGENEGLIVAEVELGAADEYFVKPSWLGKEVTGDRKYYNSALTSNPYKMWK